MTKPGPMDWATNDLWVAGPNIGTETKAAPSTAQTEDGMYTARRPSPQIRNWLDHRAGLLQRMVSRMMAANLILEDGSNVVLAGLNLETFAYDQLNGTHYTFFQINAGADYIRYSASLGGAAWGGLASANSVAAYHTRLNADCSHDGRVMVIATSDAGAGLVRWMDFGAFPWAAPAAPIPTAALNWGSIACDRDTAGVGNALWIIGDRSAGGNSILWSSATAPPAAPLFANVAGYPALGAGEVVSGIWHTKHPVDALGPDDTGNPGWLVITPTFAVRSADGATWTSAAHGFTVAGPGEVDPHGAAYSRTSRRWVVGYGPHMSYSDDSGATWVEQLNVFPNNAAAADVCVACDGYGTFIASERNTGNDGFYISVDEGISWEFVGYPHGGFAGDTCVAEAFDSSKNIDDQDDFMNCFRHVFYDGAGPLFHPYRSLAI